MLNRRFAGPIAATFQGDPPGVANWLSSLVSTAIVVSFQEDHRDAVDLGDRDPDAYGGARVGATLETEDNLGGPRRNSLWAGLGAFSQRSVGRIPQATAHDRRVGLPHAIQLARIGGVLDHASDRRAVPLLRTWCLHSGPVERVGDPARGESAVGVSEDPPDHVRLLVDRGEL